MPVVRAAAKTACTEMVSLFVMGQPASSDPILDAHSVMHRPEKSYQVKNTQIELNASMSMDLALLWRKKQA